MFLDNGYNVLLSLHLLGFEIPLMKHWEGDDLLSSGGLHIVSTLDPYLTYSCLLFCMTPRSTARGETLAVQPC